MNLPDIEIVAAKVHEAWMESKRKSGVTSRTSETGEELMVPYSKLSEGAKELDRASVRAVYTAIEEVTKSIQTATG
jgi:hypothetical protein